MQDFLRKGFNLGLGALTATKEKVEEVVNELIKKGEVGQEEGKKLINELIEKGLRAEIKDENETVSKKIREGEIQKIPYLIVVGDKEIETKSISVRQRKKGNINAMKLDEFIKKAEEEIKCKT